MPRIRRFAPVAALLIVAPTLGVVAQGRPDSSGISRVIQGLRSNVQVSSRPVRTWSLIERMAQYKTPGVSVAVISDGRIAWARGFGVKEAGTNDSVTAETLFQAASVSKPVAATATMRLVAQGKLGLDTEVNRYLKSWRVPGNRFTETEKVTLRRLLSHTAGLTVHGFPGYAATVPVPTVVQVLNGEKPANTAAVRVDTTPGALWRYAGGGTTVQQLVLTDRTGEPFPVLMNRLVLSPIGMTRSTYEQPLPESRWADAARAHRGSGQMIPGRWHTYPEMAAAGLWTTPTDLAKWALAVAAAWSGADSSLLPRPLAREMLTDQKGSYGLGPGVEGTGRAFRFGHGGANAGFRSQVLYYPEAGVGAAVMVSSDNGGDLIQEIMNAIAAEYRWPDRAPRTIEAIALDSAGLAAAAGTWRMGPADRGFGLTIELKDGTLWSRAPFNVMPEELVPVAPGDFVGLSRGWRFEIRGDSIGIVTGPTNRIGGRRSEGSRRGEPGARSPDA